MSNWFKLFSNEVIAVKLLICLTFGLSCPPHGRATCLSVANDCRGLLDAWQRLEVSVGQQRGGCVLSRAGACAVRQLRWQGHGSVAERLSHTRNQERSRTVCR